MTIKTCKNCGISFKSKRKDAQFCGDTCSKSFRRCVRDNVTDKDVRDNNEVFDESERTFVPNWTKKFKTRREAQEALFALIGIQPNIRFKFLGYDIDTTRK